MTALSLQAGSNGRRWRTLLAGVLCCAAVWPVLVHAEQVHVRQTEISLVDNVYRLDADIDYALPDVVLNALNNGVVLTFAVDIEVYRDREYLWNKVVAALEQRYEIQYHALTDQYLLHNVNSGSHLSYDSLGNALLSLGTLRQLPVIDTALLEDDVNYQLRISARLDFGKLPVPLQLKAYVTPEWRLGSDWHVQALRGDDPS